MYLIFLNGQGNLEYASFSALALNFNSAFHLVYQFFDNGQTEPGSHIVGPRILTFLGKRLKNMIYKILSDTNSGIFNDKAVICCFVLSGNFI